MKRKLANRIGFFWRMFWTCRFLKRGTMVLNVGQRPGERPIYEWGWYIIAKMKNRKNKTQAKQIQDSNV